MKTRSEIIQEVINKFNGNRIQVIFFNNLDIPYVPYWYEEAADALVTQYASVTITHKTEDININIIEAYISKLEDKLIKYYKDNMNIELKSYDD